MVDGGDLYIPLAGDLSVEVQGGFDEVRASMGDRKTFGLTVATLVTGRNKATPVAKLIHGGKALNILNEGAVDSGTD